MQNINLPEGHMQTPLALHVGINYGKGGEGRIFSELSKFLPTAGINFIGVVGGPDNVLQTTNGQVVSFAPQNSSMRTRLLGARAMISKALRDSKPDIVASHFALYTAPALDLLQPFRKVVHFHGPWAVESLQEGASRSSAFAKSQLEKLVYRRADLVIVLSKAFAELAVSLYRIDAQRIRIVPGAVDVARFFLDGTREQSRSLLNLPLDRPILLSVRRLVKRMGLGFLIEAMKTISAKVPDVLLCIGGEGPLRKELEQQVNDSNIHRHVRFLGYIEEDYLPHLYHAADINVVPTLALEGFGLVAAEAMAAGTPSIVTPVGGLPEVVSDLSPNLVFASSSSADIAEGLIDALLGRVVLPSNAACQSFISANFTSALMASRTAAVYKELLH
jgi:glycosyltransferase involved in cell wall biosynthesis